jgi:hypothetical protein
VGQERPLLILPAAGERVAVDAREDRALAAFTHLEQALTDLRVDTARRNVGEGRLWPGSSGA